jgi:hypothetical protein
VFRKLAVMTDPEGKPEAPRYAPRPRWVKVLGIIALLIALATVIVLVIRGPHGPGMHGGLGDAAPTASRQW